MGATVCGEDCVMGLTLCCCVYMIFTLSFMSSTLWQTDLTVWTSSELSFQTIFFQENKHSTQMEIECMSSDSKITFIWLPIFDVNFFILSKDITGTYMSHIPPLNLSRGRSQWEFWSGGALSIHLLKGICLFACLMLPIAALANSGSSWIFNKFAFFSLT